MWQNPTIAALYSRSLHASGNITRLSWHDDLPFSLGDCHAGEVLHPTHDHRSHPQVLDRFRRRAIRQLWMAERRYTDRSVSRRILPIRTEEVTALFRSLPRQGHRALRDRTLRLFLYSTGARVQEVADLRIEHLELKPPAKVH